LHRRYVAIGKKLGKGAKYGTRKLGTTGAHANSVPIGTNAELEREAADSVEEDQEASTSVSRVE